MNLKALAYQLRRDTIDIICAGKAGHIGGDMSVMEVLVELYFDQMNIDAKIQKIRTEICLYSVRVIPWRHTMQCFRKKDFWTRRCPEKFQQIWF